MKRIKFLEIENSPFFNDLKLDFSEKLTCIMGGRGTGKTTIMTFVNAALDQNLENDREISNLLKENLGNGKITLWIEDETGVEYKVVKTYTDEPQAHEVTSGKLIPVSRLRADLACDFYPAGRIELIGRSPLDRLSLIDKKVSGQLLHLKSDISQIQIKLDSNAKDVLSTNESIKTIEDLISHYDGIEEDFKAHQNQKVVGIGEAERKIFEEADKSEQTRKNEKRFFRKGLDFIKNLRNHIESIKFEISDFRDNHLSITDAFVNKDEMLETKQVLKSATDEYDQLTSSFSSLLDQYNNKISALLDNLGDKHDFQQSQFIQLKQKFEKNREYINKYNELSKKVNERNNLERDKVEFFQKRHRFLAEREKLLSRFKEIKQLIYNTRLRCVKELNETFQGEINITLKYGGITEEYENLLRNSLVGSGLKYNELVQRIIQYFSPDEFASIIHNRDFNKLKYIKGIDESRSETLINVLFDCENIYKIETLYCEDLPEFNLKVKGSHDTMESYRRTEDLSLGQRCTTVLPIAFSVSSDPLIIDQPEDNLDNRFITSKIHQIIRDQKERRQLIFITHNPNIPVLSDAEKNIFLSFDLKASIWAEGTIDDVKEQILQLLEGGKEAFDRRSAIYGYAKDTTS